MKKKYKNCSTVHGLNLPNFVFKEPKIFVTSQLTSFMAYLKTTTSDRLQQLQNPNFQKKANQIEPTPTHRKKPGTKIQNPKRKASFKIWKAGIDPRGTLYLASNTVRYRGSFTYLVNDNLGETWKRILMSQMPYPRPRR